MKKILFLLLVIVFLPVQVHAQMTILAPSIDALLTATGIADAIYFAQNMAQFILSVANTAATVENLVRQVQMAEQNLSRIGDVHSFNDLMEWYNRQLYLERRSIETFKGMGLTIGKNKYKITDIEGMAYGFNETFVDYWNQEFTEEQNREMWLGLGLTPANYAYVQTWKDREKNIARRFLTAASNKNQEYMDDMTRNNDILENIEADKNRGIDDKMGEKELLALNTEMAVHNNKALNDISYSLAEMQELEALKIYQDQDIYFPPPAASESYDKVYFRKLK